jgi:hypothetical protein
LFTPFDDLNNLSQDDGDEEAMLNLVESLDEDYEENFTYVFPESINIMEILDELCNQSCETVQEIIFGGLRKSVLLKLFT